MQMSLFSPTEPQDGLCPDEMSRVAAPRWLFGRINKKKGRHVQVLKVHPGAAIVCIAYPLVK
jgi:hypothetical protein